MSCGKFIFHKLSWRSIIIVHISEEVINKRLNRAKEESEDMDKYDYIVINDQVEDCADRIHAIVQAKECLLGNNLKFIEATKKELEQL